MEEVKVEPSSSMVSIQGDDETEEGIYKKTKQVSKVLKEVPLPQLTKADPEAISSLMMKNSPQLVGLMLFLIGLTLVKLFGWLNELILNKVYCYHLCLKLMQNLFSL